MEWSGSGPTEGDQSTLSEVGSHLQGGLALFGLLIFIGGLLTVMRAGDGNKDGKSGWGKAIIMMAVGTFMVVLGGGSMLGG
ncbi:MAG: hypothetical protein VR70_11030 [Rhodospirillaceae bacterium BRH_c57]|nr:MAG: hypothetical protein VR70_11030 [Rhodospirillaceae bacterium BRH_c57]